MVTINSSYFRNSLQVTPERIAALKDSELTRLMRQLLLAEAYKCGSPLNEIRVNTEDKAKDKGCDGWSAKPQSPNDWLGSSDTCWQFKAGVSGEPARLLGEISKPLPKETLLQGGRVVIIASGSTNGLDGELLRLKNLREEASARKIPNNNIEVMGSERLANWCNQHLAIASSLTDRPSGLWTLSDWSNSPQHQVPYQASATAQLEIGSRRSDLDFTSGSVYHLHIFGPPGVGKTRFALELCREAPWQNEVIYIRDASDIRLIELIDSVTREAGTLLVVVADEVQPEQLLILRDSIDRGDGRVRLITIGHSGSPNPNRIPVLQVKPLDSEIMKKVIKGFYPSMPPEHIDFVVWYADGYVRLARMMSDAIALDPNMDVRTLLSKDEIRKFLDGMLGTGDRRPLYVVAVLTSVGWSDDKQVEGEAIAKHFGLEWNLVRSVVADFDRRLGIAPQGGRYRYISPTPLGIHLAAEAWTIYPDLMKTLPGILPSEEARNAYFNRLQSMASNPQTRNFAREELAFFFRIDNFIDARGVRRWSALSAADPDEATRNILTALNGSSIENRLQIKDSARREIVWMLVRLAWRSSSFHDAVKSLALLAEAENESWANNATSEFIGKFQIFLGGTAVPYIDRLSVLDELLQGNNLLLVSLTVKALAEVGNQHASRTVSRPASDELPEREWRPSSSTEHFKCIEAAILRLIDIANHSDANILPDLIAAAHGLSMMLRETALRRLVISFFNSIRIAFPETREILRKEIDSIIRREEKYVKELSAQEINELKKLHSGFEDSSLEARLQQFVGVVEWDQEEKLDLSSLAKELVNAPSVLINQWPWLTSGEAMGAWWLGEALAKVDSKGNLEEILPSISEGGNDLRLICGYVRYRRSSSGEKWYEKWVSTQFERDPKPISLLFEVAWRCGVNETIANVLVNLLLNNDVNSRIVGQLGYGRWEGNLSIEVLEKLLRAMTSTGNRDTALKILGDRVKAIPNELNHWEPIALELVTSPEIIRSKNSMVSLYWKEIINLIISKHAKEIAAAIFREQVSGGSDLWFAEFSEAVSVLQACVEMDSNGIWQEMLIYLSDPERAYRFVAGFPRGVLDRINPDIVEEWISVAPEDRSDLIAQITSKDLTTDDTLASRILSKYGDIKNVADSFLSEFISGVRVGPPSLHYDQLAKSLNEVAARTEMPKLRNWAYNSARYLQNLAEQERSREAEQNIRGR